MTFTAAVVTTFPNSALEIYGRKMLESMRDYWPKEIALLVMLDDDKLVDEVGKIIRPQDGILINENAEHKAFLERNKDKDHPTDYRKQACRFSHKVWALKAASDMWKTQPGKCRYLIWLDADVILSRPVTVDDLKACMPREGDDAAYLGRQDWDHSECGWLAFDLTMGGHDIIDRVYEYYVSDKIFSLEQWHDSFVWDKVRGEIALEVVGAAKDFRENMRAWTNLTFRKPGREIWPHSPMAAWSKHYKGPVAKQEMVPKAVQAAPSSGGIRIQTKNSIPDDLIQRQIMENQAQIKNWIGPCAKTNEEMVIVSAGPQLIAEDLQAEVDAGRKIIAVKHALEPLKEAGIKPWACILLDPRPHLYKFVENPDTDILWFVASQVDPKVVRKLLDSGCTVWGYHAAVGANEGFLTERQFGAVIAGGSATATRGLFMLERIGFTNFRLYGYDLCVSDRPDMHEKDQLNQPMYFDYTITAGGPAYVAKKAFWTKAELIAQFEELNQIMQMKTDWKIKAFGHGMVPFVFRAKEVNDLRSGKKLYKLTGGNPPNYLDMLWPNKKTLSVAWPKWLLPARRKPKKASSF